MPFLRPTPRVDAFAWTIPDNQALSPSLPSQSIAIGMTGLTAQVSPDLPPGETLVQAGSNLSIETNVSTPAVDITRDWYIEVLDSPIATIVNATLGITYEPGSYTTPSGTFGNTRWGRVLYDVATSSTPQPHQILISPGAAQQLGEFGHTYWSGNVDSCILEIPVGINISNMPGRGRWSLYPTVAPMTGGLCGINIYNPGESWTPGRRDFTLEGFQFDNWGNNSDAKGVKIRSIGNPPTDSWADHHISLTLRNFKFGKPPYERSASGIDGTVEFATLENGHIYDLGGGLGSPDGNDHNIYFSAGTLVMRGIRLSRTRGNTALGFWEGGSDMDGHLLKLSCITALIEGCVFEADPIYGDNSLHCQFKAGGNVVMRGCLFIGSVHTQNQGQGMIVMTREYNGSGGANFHTWWDAFRSGNSLFVEKCVFVDHYGKPNIFFFPPGTPQSGYMAPGTGADQISSVVIRDNIGMVAATPTADAPFSNAKWIKNDPTGGSPWSTNNSTETYDSNEAPFTERHVKSYTRLAGPIAAGAGSVSTYRFLWPHGSVVRSDPYRGLG